MQKKVFMFLILCLAALSANAQWKVTSVEKSEPYTKLLQVIETENSTLVYATINRECSKVQTISLNRSTCAKVGGLKYKIINSVNLPLGDEAEPRYATFQKGENEVNFVMEFEKFPVKDGFDIVENGKDGEWNFNFSGVKVSPVDASEVIDTERFLDSGAPVISGKYAKGGTHYLYRIRDGVCVTCNAVITGNALMGKDEVFYVDIVNDSNHGVMFNFDKVSVCGEKEKSNGDVESKGWAKYNPDSYEQYLSQLDYDEARYKNAGVLDMVGSKLDSDKYKKTTSGSWERIGYEALSALNEQAIQNRVNEYMQEHPKNRPSALKSESIKSGDSIHGYIAAKRKKADSVVLTIPMDGYDFKFTYSLK